MTAIIFFAAYRELCDMVGSFYLTKSYIRQQLVHAIVDRRMKLLIPFNDQFKELFIEQIKKVFYIHEDTFISINSKMLETATIKEGDFETNFITLIKMYCLFMTRT